MSFVLPLIGAGKREGGVDLGPIVGGEQLILRADVGIALSGSDVSQWDDQSGGSNHATQGTGADQPLFIASDSAFNNEPVVEFDRVSEHLLADGVSGVQNGNDLAYTVIMVLAAATSAVNGQAFVNWGGSSDTLNYSYIYKAFTNVMGLARADDLGGIFQAGTVDVGSPTPQVLSIINAGTTISSWHDGVLDVNAAAYDRTNAMTIDKFTIGARRQATTFGYVEMRLAELRVYNAVLSDANRISVQNYMLSRYGL